MSEDKKEQRKPIAIRNVTTDLWIDFQAAARKRYGYGGTAKAFEQALMAWIRKNKRGKEGAR